MARASGTTNMMRRATPAAPRAVALALALGLALAPRACAAVLRDARFEDNDREAVLMLRFDVEPPIRYIPMTESRILILDFGNAAFPSGREKFAPRTALVEYLSLAQFDREKLRLILKVATGTVVNVYRYPVPGTTEVRFAVVVEREASLDRFPVIPGRKTRPRIVFDPGHGGHDNGAIGTVTSDKEIALAVARELKRLFDADPRVEVYYTRLSDHFVPLEDRTAFARKVDADCFVSLHANTMVRDGWTTGVEVWYLSESGASKEMTRTLQEKGLNPARGATRRRPVTGGGGVDRIILSMQQSKTLSQSSLLARLLNRNLIHWTGQPTRGVKRSNFRVLRPIEVPSCLVEFGFLSSATEERLMTTRLYQQRAARAIYDGVMDWMARTGRITGLAARGLIQGDVSTAERGEVASGTVEEEMAGERVHLPAVAPRPLAHARARLRMLRRR
jgi:N-acetylmuramoyl-L-alanine amidase